MKKVNKQERKEKRKESLQTLRRIFAEHSRFKWQIAFCVTLHILIVLGWSAWPFCVAHIIDGLANEATWAEVQGWIIALCGVVVVNVALMYGRWRFEVKVLDNVVNDFIAETTLRHLNTLSIGQHQSKNSVVTASKVMNGESALRGIFDTVIYNMLPSLIHALIASTVMLVIYPIPGLVTVFLCAIVIFATLRIAVLFYKPIKRLNTFQHKKIRKTGGEFLRHAGSAMLASAEHRLVDQHMERRDFRQRIHEGIYYPMGRNMAAMWATSNLGRVAIIAIAAFLVFKGHYQVGAIAAVMAWSNQAIRGTMDLQHLVRRILQQWADVTTFFEIRDTTPDIEVSPNAPQLATIQGRLVFDGVFFSYPKTDEHALKNVSFEVRPGQTVAIVGPSGAGKTTVLKLMEGAYKPALGSIRIDGYELTSLDLHTLRRMVGFIEQKPCLFDQSLLDNLLLACSDTRRDYLLRNKGEIHEVLRRVGLVHLIERLGDRVGENGDKLSGGEGQRVTIARAILQEPEMLVIDEATSAVDPENEEEVHRLIDSIAQSATKIVVAHRLSTVQDSDLILVMEEGQIVGQGTHESLLETCELYQRLASKSLLRV